MVITALLKSGLRSHQEQVVVNVQVSVADAAPVFHGLSGHSPLLLPLLAAQGQSWTPETAVKGHTDSVEAPG